MSCYLSILPWDQFSHFKMFSFSSPLVFINSKVQKVNLFLGSFSKSQIISRPSVVSFYCSVKSKMTWCFYSFSLRRPQRNSCNSAKIKPSAVRLNPAFQKDYTWKSDRTTSEHRSSRSRCWCKSVEREKTSTCETKEDSLHIFCSTLSFCKTMFVLTLKKSLRGKN